MNGWLTGLLIVAVLILLVLCLFMGMRLLRLHEQSEQLKQEFRSSQTSNEARLSTMQEMMNSLNKETSQNLALNSRMESSLSQITAVMTNAKQRGNWGEYQLETLLRLYAGNWPGVLTMQKTLSNGKIADAAFSLPQTNRVLCIDSKFPMENYLRILEAEPQEELACQRLFEKNVRKHISDIANKYILPSETAEYAVMFLPSEAIYEFICAECPSLMEEAMTKRVLLAGPTTLGGLVFTLLGTVRDSRQSEVIAEMQKKIASFDETMQKLLAREADLGRSLHAADQKYTSLRKDTERLKRSWDQLVYSSMQKEDENENAPSSYDPAFHRQESLFLTEEDDEGLE